MFYVVGGDMLKPDEVRRQTSISRNSDTDFPELNITCDIDELAASALSRAKTDVCKQQLADVACRISNSTLIPKKLPRYCPTQCEFRIQSLCEKTVLHMCEKRRRILAGARFRL